VPASALVNAPAPLPITPLTTVFPAPPIKRSCEPLVIFPLNVKISASELILTPLADDEISIVP
jgi:hypothetical protein